MIKKPDFAHTYIKSFAAKVDKRGSDECWEWQAGKGGSLGYGKIKIKGKTYLAHRVSWELFFGPIPKGMMVLHKCNNPPCVNPYHLYLGDQSDNMQDRSRAGHMGGRPEPKLYKDEVLVIRSLLQAGKLSQEAIAKMFGVNRRTISRVKLNPNHPYKTRRASK